MRPRRTHDSIATASARSPAARSTNVFIRRWNSMQLGMVGLGRMGSNMVRRLMAGGHECVVTDLNAGNVKALAAEGATGAPSLDDFVGKLTRPRAAWVMVPAGAPTEQTVMALADRMQSGDI